MCGVIRMRCHVYVTDVQGDLHPKFIVFGVLHACVLLGSITMVAISYAILSNTLCIVTTEQRTDSQYDNGTHDHRQPCALATPP